MYLNVSHYDELIVLEQVQIQKYKIINNKYYFFKYIAILN